MSCVIVSSYVSCVYLWSERSCVCVKGKYVSMSVAIFHDVSSNISYTSVDLYHVLRRLRDVFFSVSLAMTCSNVSSHM
jgi:hypothetical protein